MSSGHFVTWPERSSASLYSLAGGYWTRGQQITSEVIVPVNGRAVLQNVSKGSAFFTADVVGYYTYPAKMPGSVFLPATPTRLLKVTVGGKHWVKLPVTGNDRHLQQRAWPVTLAVDLTGYFAEVTVDSEAGTVTWPGGIDLAPGRFTSRQRLVRSSLPPERSCNTARGGEWSWPSSRR
jgi:hypothetical protein